MDLSSYVGLPWRDRGRDASGFDCWGLFRTAFEDGTGIALPSYASEYRTAADRAETAAVLSGQVGDWTPVTAGQERIFDGVVMLVHGRFHIGLVVARGLMLHMPFGGTSVIEPWAGRYNLDGLFRHKRLA